MHMYVFNIYFVEEAVMNVNIFTKMCWYLLVEEPSFSAYWLYLVFLPSQLVKEGMKVWILPLCLFYNIKLLISHAVSIAFQPYLCKIWFIFLTFLWQQVSQTGCS